MPLLLLSVCAFTSALSLCGCYDKQPQTEWLKTTPKRILSQSRGPEVQNQGVAGPCVPPGTRCGLADPG